MEQVKSFNLEKLPQALVTGGSGKNDPTEVTVLFIWWQMWQHQGRGGWEESSNLPISSQQVKPPTWRGRELAELPGAHKSQSPSGLAPGFIKYQAFWARKRLNKTWFSL